MFDEARAPSMQSGRLARREAYSPSGALARLCVPSRPGNGTALGPKLAPGVPGRSLGAARTGFAQDRAQQSPSASTPVPAALAEQALEYVTPSQPQTGTYSFEQNSGRGWQTEDASAAPQCSPGT